MQSSDSQASSRLVLSVSEELLGISRDLAYDLAARGELPTLRLRPSHPSSQGRGSSRSCTKWSPGPERHGRIGPAVAPRARRSVEAARYPAWWGDLAPPDRLPAAGPVEGLGCSRTQRYRPVIVGRCRTASALHARRRRPMPRRLYAAATCRLSSSAPKVGSPSKHRVSESPPAPLRPRRGRCSAYHLSRLVAQTKRRSGPRRHHHRGRRRSMRRASDDASCPRARPLRPWRQWCGRDGTAGPPRRPREVLLIDRGVGTLRQARWGDRQGNQIPQILVMKFGVDIQSFK